MKSNFYPKPKPPKKNIKNELFDWANRASIVFLYLSELIAKLCACVSVVGRDAADWVYVCVRAFILKMLMSISVCLGAGKCGECE